jgi:uncharacterized protein (TIGR03083 family)
MISVQSVSPIQDAARIPYVTADEAHQLLQVAVARFLALVETLGPQDWDRPTACSAWTVRDILAHQAGNHAGGAGYRALIADAAIRTQPGQLMEDAINARQLAQRAGKSPAELIAELRQAAPRAMRNWAYHFRLPKLFAIPHGQVGSLPLRHLMWVIHSRDTWMHRLDICRAAGRAFEQTPEHDGRIAALVMRDAAAQLAPRLGGQSLLFDLSGTAGGRWQVGMGQPTAEVGMDVLDFNILASGRVSSEEGLARATITGDIALAKKMLQGLLILY